MVNHQKAFTKINTNGDQTMLTQNHQQIKYKIDRPRMFKIKKVYKVNDDRLKLIQTQSNANDYQI